MRHPCILAASKGKAFAINVIDGQQKVKPTLQKSIPSFITTEYN